VETFQPTQRPTRNGDDISVANSKVGRSANAGRMAGQRACIGPGRIERLTMCPSPSKLNADPLAD
jgi:hypothetical protein